ncbi:hypothetical protein CANARDRAFT_27447 [[Candida] arabinofermentans NRRL YB-2248]|uniref:Major facilitator superfamily (MFS) profile domain-containing protein n=1 Tax=[Candida] arabinofermentans NRRL YB-2248 TaxID=983967 RepID=A0A1E4T358_9ASCO|nr:hypothetical protein CANARDRAFT_27447 [[Candida] arabinofermentans NRRL YB-2248]
MSSIKEKSPSSLESGSYHGEIPQFMGMSGKKLHLIITVMASVCFLLFGYDQGVMGSLLTLDAFRDTFPSINTAKHPDNATMQGFTIAVYEIGCLAGALSTMYFGDKLGRTKCMFVGCIIMIVGAVLQTTAYSVAHLIVGRIVTGVGNGMNTSTVPMWLSECAKPADRGILVMISGAMITCGIMISYWIDFGFYFTTGDVSWRFPIAFQIVFALMVLPFVLKFPESPRWLCKAGRYEDAKKVFASLEGTTLDDTEVLKELEEVRASLAEEELLGASSFNITKMFSQGQHRNFHRVMLGFWSQVFQQITGINLITYYAGTIFETYIGMSPLKSRILAACNGTEYFLASWIPCFMIEKFGRRKLMIWGAVGQSFCMAVLTGTTWASDHKDNNGAAIAAAVFLFLFNTCFAIGWLGMSWLYQAEIPALSVRAPSNALSTAGNWSFNFMVVMITPVAFENIGSYTYTIFAVINLLMVPALYFFFPETAGRSLEEMDDIFAQCDPWKPWDIVPIARNHPRLGHSHAYTGEAYTSGHEVFVDKAVNEHVESADLSEDL